MENDNRDQRLFCPCWTECDIEGHFQLLASLKNVRLDLYRQVTPDVAAAAGGIDAPYTTEESYVINCESSVQMTRSEFARELGSNLMSCPRCRQVIERAKNVLRNVAISSKVQTFGVCTHCSAKQERFCRFCPEVVKQFIDWQEKRKQESQQSIKKLYSQRDSGGVLCNIRTRDRDPFKVIRTRSYSDFPQHIDYDQQEYNLTHVPLTRVNSYDYLLNELEENRRFVEVFPLNDESVDSYFEMSYKTSADILDNLHKYSPRAKIKKKKDTRKFQEVFEVKQTSTGNLVDLEPSQNQKSIASKVERLIKSAPKKLKETKGSRTVYQDSDSSYKEKGLTGDKNKVHTKLSRKSSLFGRPRTIKPKIKPKPLRVGNKFPNLAGDIGISSKDESKKKRVSKSSEKRDGGHRDIFSKKKKESEGILAKESSLGDLPRKKLKPLRSFSSVTTVTSKLSKKINLKSNFKYIFPKKRSGSKRRESTIIRFDKKSKHSHGDDIKAKLKRSKEDQKKEAILEKRRSRSISKDIKKKVKPKELKSKQDDLVLASGDEKRYEKNNIEEKKQREQELLVKMDSESEVSVDFEKSEEKSTKQDNTENKKQTQEEKQKGDAKKRKEVFGKILKIKPLESQALVKQKQKKVEPLKDDEKKKDRDKVSAKKMGQEKIQVKPQTVLDKEKEFHDTKPRPLLEPTKDSKKNKHDDDKKKKDIKKSDKKEEKHKILESKNEKEDENKRKKLAKKDDKKEQDHEEDYVKKKEIKKKDKKEDKNKNLETKREQDSKKEKGLQNFDKKEETVYKKQKGAKKDDKNMQKHGNFEVKKQQQEEADKKEKGLKKVEKKEEIDKLLDIKQLEKEQHETHKKEMNALEQAVKKKFKRQNKMLFEIQIAKELDKEENIDYNIQGKEETADIDKELSKRTAKAGKESKERIEKSTLKDAQNPPAPELNLSKESATPTVKELATAKVKESTSTKGMDLKKSIKANIEAEKKKVTDTKERVGSKTKIDVEKKESGDQKEKKESKAHIAIAEKQVKGEKDGLGSKSYAERKKKEGKDNKVSSKTKLKLLSESSKEDKTNFDVKAKTSENLKEISLIKVGDDGGQKDEEEDITEAKTKGMKVLLDLRKISKGEKRQPQDKTVPTTDKQQNVPVDSQIKVKKDDLPDSGSKQKGELELSLPKKSKSKISTKIKQSDTEIIEPIPEIKTKKSSTNNAEISQVQEDRLEKIKYKRLFDTLEKDKVKTEHDDEQKNETEKEAQDEPHDEANAIFMKAISELKKSKKVGKAQEFGALFGKKIEDKNIYDSQPLTKEELDIKNKGFTSTIPEAASDKPLAKPTQDKKTKEMGEIYKEIGIVSGKIVKNVIMPLDENVAVKAPKEERQIDIAAEDDLEQDLETKLKEKQAKKEKDYKDKVNAIFMEALLELKKAKQAQKEQQQYEIEQKTKEVEMKKRQDEIERLLKEEKKDENQPKIQDLSDTELKKKGLLGSISEKAFEIPLLKKSQKKHNLSLKKGKSEAETAVSQIEMKSTTADDLIVAQKENKMKTRGKSTEVKDKKGSETKFKKISKKLETEISKTKLFKGEKSKEDKETLDKANAKANFIKALLNLKIIKDEKKLLVDKGTKTKTDLSDSESEATSLQVSVPQKASKIHKKSQDKISIKSSGSEITIAVPSLETLMTKKSTDDVNLIAQKKGPFTKLQLDEIERKTKEVQQKRQLTEIEKIILEDKNISVADKSTKTDISDKDSDEKIISQKTAGSPFYKKSQDKIPIKKGERPLHKVSQDKISIKNETATIKSSKAKFRKLNEISEAEIVKARLIEEQKAREEKEYRAKLNAEANVIFMKALSELKKGTKNEKNHDDDIEQKNKTTIKKDLSDNEHKTEGLPGKVPGKIFERPHRKQSEDKTLMFKSGDETEITIPLTEIKVEKPSNISVPLSVKISNENEVIPISTEEDANMAKLVEKIHKVFESRTKNRLLMAGDSDIGLEVLQKPYLERHLIIGNNIKKADSFFTLQQEAFHNLQTISNYEVQLHIPKSDMALKEKMSTKVTDYETKVVHVPSKDILSKTGRQDYEYAVFTMSKERIAEKNKSVDISNKIKPYQNANSKQQKYIHDRSQKDKMKFAKGDGNIDATIAAIQRLNSSTSETLISDLLYKPNRHRQQNVSKFTVSSSPTMAYRFEIMDAPVYAMHEIIVQNPFKAKAESKKLDHLSSAPKPKLNMNMNMKTEDDMGPIIAKANKDHLAKMKAKNEIEVESLKDTETLPVRPSSIQGKKSVIIGRKITETESVIIKEEEEEEKEVEGNFVIIQHEFKSPSKSINVLPKQIEESAPLKNVEEESVKGVIHYSLSDREFIDKGWTMLPTEKIVRKMNVYRMRPAKPEFDWFERNKQKKMTYYDSGEKLAEIDDNGRGRWYYRNGRLAMDYYNAEEVNAQQRIVIYSSGEPDEKGRTYPVTVLAMFDYVGNGVVFDHSGKIRLKYNQSEGVVLDRNIGPVSNWKWHCLNDPPVLQQVMIDTQLSHKDPNILKLGPHHKQPPADNEEMLAIEFDNFIREKSRKLAQSFKPYQIRMKALKINEYFSLRVIDQATVYLLFRDGTTNLKLNIGMILDHQEIIDTDTAELGDVSSSVERFPARTDSLEHLQKSVAHAQHVERVLAERDQRLRPRVPVASADHLVRAASRALKPPLVTASCHSIYRKTSCPNIYYNNRFI